MMFTNDYFLLCRKRRDIDDVIVVSLGPCEEMFKPLQFSPKVHIRGGNWSTRPQKCISVIQKHVAFAHKEGYNQGG
jgi:hypothetical protein